MTVRKGKTGRTTGATFALLLLLLAPAFAQPAAEAAIRAALTQWTQDFNAGHADKVCDLFARDLIVNFRGVPERDYDAQCGLLQRALADPARRFSYALNLREIIVAGDIAVVRLTWTSTLREAATGRETQTVEPGMDIFRKEPDGKWRIMRYMAWD